MAATIQFQFGACQIISGMGSAASHPSSSTFFRPMLSDRRPAMKFMVPLTRPNATTNELSKTNESLGRPKSDSAKAGTTVRVMPMVSPTSSTWRSWCKNWLRLWLMPWRSAALFSETLVWNITMPDWPSFAGCCNSPRGFSVDPLRIQRHRPSATGLFARLHARQVCLPI